MAEEIRPARIVLPRRVRQVSREDREENEERFRKKLAELTDEQERTRDEHRDAHERAEAGDEPPEHERDGDPKRGRNLDLRT
ncbi:MAG: hypothetical protein AMK73_00870 [Planctomycetes bacterium SM23_32]|nr:MAG: hypothetical protein AMK73_00870 [Planctomycetes bacterium SM23_32]